MSDALSPESGFKANVPTGTASVTSGTPSVTYNGILLPVVPKPLILISTPAPGSPLIDVT